MPRQQLRAAIGARLREARAMAKLTQEDVAAEIGRTRQSVSAWEGARALPSLEEFCQLLICYGVTADQVLLGVHDIAAVGRQVVGRASASARAGDQAEVSE
jgi:transcriptional regulator with XRE-family HTH domain